MTHGGEGRTAVGKAGPAEDHAAEDLHSTKRANWIAVVLMCLGAVLVGVGMIVANEALDTGLVVGGVGMVVGVVGLVVAVRYRIMESGH